MIRVSRRNKIPAWHGLRVRQTPAPKKTRRLLHLCLGSQGLGRVSFVVFWCLGGWSLCITGRVHVTITVGATEKLHAFGTSGLLTIFPACLRELHVCTARISHVQYIHTSLSLTSVSLGTGRSGFVLGDGGCDASDMHEEMLEKRAAACMSSIHHPPSLSSMDSLVRSVVPT